MEDEEKEELAGAVDGREEVARAPERGIRVARSELVRRGGVQSEKGDRLGPDFGALWGKSRVDALLIQKQRQRPIDSALSMRPRALPPTSS